MKVPSQSSEWNAPLIMAWGCSCASLVISFVGLSQFDLPIVRYVRSVTIHRPWDQLTIPWMAFTSNAGDWIGEGSHLVIGSILLLVAGWLLRKPSVMMAALQSLIAHLLAAISVNGLKHLIGRPRPKFVHSGEWQLTMSWTSGWDSFPSGHSAASFAVATVLARRFPAVGFIGIGIAAFVALGRILRGAHFPTDVVGGAVLGSVCGAIASASLKQWRTSLLDGLRHAAMGAAVFLALLWALSRHMDDGVIGTLLLALAATAIVGGLWLRRGYWLAREKVMPGWQVKASTLLLAYGLSAMATSPLVLASMGFVCLAFWFTPVASVDEPSQGSSGWMVVREGAMVGGLVLAVLTLTYARGVLPFH